MKEQMEIGYLTPVINSLACYMPDELDERVGLNLLVAAVKKRFKGFARPQVSALMAQHRALLLNLAENGYPAAAWVSGALETELLDCEELSSEEDFSLDKLKLTKIFSELTGGEFRVMSIKKTILVSDASMRSGMVVQCFESVWLDSIKRLFENKTSLPKKIHGYSAIEYRDPMAAWFLIDTKKLHGLLCFFQGTEAFLPVALEALKSISIKKNGPPLL